jgi:hypothetical protein
MNSLIQRHALRLVLLILLGATPLALSAKNYPAARALSSLLQPQPITPQADPTGLGKARDQMTRILNAMEKSETSGGPGANELLGQAYEFRSDVGPMRRVAAVSALVAAWREARGLGLFGPDGKFNPKITKGADNGSECVFEYIVPMNLLPELSRDIANLRIVSPSRARQISALPTPREQALATSMKAIPKEVAGLKSLASIEDGKPANAIGQTLEEATKLWKAQMLSDGDKALELPSILLEGRLGSTPSKKNGDRWTVNVEVKNLSQHATEVELECLIVGVTEKHRVLYLMGGEKKKLQLRSSQAEDLVFATPLKEGDYKNRGDDFEKLTKAERKSSQASYRGTIFRVTHAKGIAATFATDPALLRLLENEGDTTARINQMARLYLDPKTWPKSAIEE